jgi:antitoxin component of MazEF toxin-antitoxin module
VKSTYIVQPYRVGSKQGESLALVIPARLRREADITNSTILMIKIDEHTKRITVQKIDEIIEKFENMIPAVKSLETTKQQVPSVVQ